MDDSDSGEDTRSSNSSDSARIEDKWILLLTHKNVYYMSLPRNAILSTIKNRLLNHRMDHIRSILPAFTADTRMSHMFKFKLAMLLFDQYEPKEFETFHNRTLSPFLRKNLQSLVNKREVVLEVACHLIRRNHLDLAKQVFEDNELINRKTLRKTPGIDSNYRCYLGYLRFLRWTKLKHLPELKSEIDTILALIKKSLLADSSVCLDYMTRSLAEALKYYGDHQLAVELYEIYTKKNRHNFCAHLQFFQLLELEAENLTEGSKSRRNHSLRISCFNNIAKLDPSNGLVSSICIKPPEVMSDTLVDIMDSIKHLMLFLDYNANKGHEKSWKGLVEHLMNLLRYRKRQLVEAEKFYLENFHDHWQFTHFGPESFGSLVQKASFCIIFCICNQFVKQVIKSNPKKIAKVEAEVKILRDTC